MGKQGPCMNPLSDEKNRFEMTKKSHLESFQTAVAEQKADPKIISLCRFLNRQPEFFSSSSCSGRIMLLNVDQFETKQPNAFYYKKHGKASAAEIWKKLQAETKNELWFKQEAFILHLGTDNLKNANRLLAISRTAGIKRGGIMVAKPGKFILEFIGTRQFAVPVKTGNEIIVNEPYVQILVKRANQKLGQNFAQLKRFENEIKKELKKQR